MTRVVKIGGRPQSDPALPTMIAETWDAMSGAMVLVHGGGEEVSALQKAMGITAQYVDGKRVTTPQDVDLVRMALSGTANKRLVSSLVREGVRAVGLSGEDASLIAATPVDAVRMGHVGAPQRVDGMPATPTLAELGLPAANLSSQFGLFAPGRLPASLLERLNAEVNKALAAPDLRNRLLTTGNVPTGGAAADFAREIAQESQANANIIRAANIRLD